MVTEHTGFHIKNEKKCLFKKVILENEIFHSYKKIQRGRKKYLCKLPSFQKETLQMGSQSFVSVPKYILFLPLKREP